MKAWQILAGIGLALLALVIFAPGASATTTCQGGSGPSVANTCQGYGHASTAFGGVASARCFALRTTNTAPTCTTSGLTPVNEASWQMAAGASITFYYFDTTAGVVPPAAPNAVTIAVRFDNAGTDVRVFQNAGAEPINGALYTFYATSDGTATGSPRAGTYEIFGRFIKSDGTAANNYNVATTGNNPVGSIINFDRGALRGQILLSSIARSAYPAGSTFAYGAAGDESVTVTATHTQPNGDAGVETAFTSVLDNAGLTVGQAGTTTDLDSTSLAQAFVVDNTFPAANSPYVAGFTVAGNSVLTGMKFTVLASTGHGSCVTRVSDTFAYCSTPFNVNSDIKFDSDGLGSYATADEVTVPRLTTCSGAVVQVFNKGETVCNSWYLFNARSELLSRAMTFAREDSVPTTCNSLGSLSPTANKYSSTTLISTGTTCLSAYDLVGAPRYLRVTNTDQNHRSNSLYGVSTFYYVDYHPQRTSTLVQDDWPTQNSAEHSSYVISADVMNVWCHVRGVRLDVNINTGANDVVVKETETDDITVIDSFTIGTGADGWTTTADTVNPVPPARSIHGHCTVTFNGNTGTTVQTVGWSSAFTGDLNCRLAVDDWNVTVGMASRIFLLTAQGGEDVTPDEVPHLTINYADNSTDPPTFPVLLSHSFMLNVVDDTATVNGALYYIDWTPTVASHVNIETHCQIAGSPLYQDKVISVRPAAIMTAFENLTGLSGSEFAAIMALAIVGVVLWHRSTDTGVRVFAAFLPMIGGLLIILITLEEGPGTLWSGSLGVGAILCLVGIYLLVRLFLDDLEERRAARGEA